MTAATIHFEHAAAPETPEYSLADDVYLIPAEDGSARLLAMAGSFYAIPPVGTAMLREVLAAGAATAAGRVAAVYGHSLEGVRADLEDFLADLRARGLIVRGRARGRSRCLLGTCCLAPAVFLSTSVIRRPSVRAWLTLAVARLSCRLFGLSASVAALGRRCKPGGRDASGAEARANLGAIDRAVRAAAARHLLRMECKERAIACWVLARVERFDPELVIGLNLYPMEGHCWCDAGGLTLSDHLDRCGKFTPVARYR